MRFILVDDEPQARASLHYAISKIKPQAELVEAGTGAETIELFKQLSQEGKKIDIAFLDALREEMQRLRYLRVRR